MQLTTASPVVSIQRVVGRASTNKTSNWHGQAEVGAVPVAEAHSAHLPAGGVKHEDPSHNPSGLE